MRVKLSYTVEVEEVLKEVSKLLSLQADELRSVMNDHNGLQVDLGDKGANVSAILDRFEDLRASLLSIDTRAAELSEILQGYAEYQLSQHRGSDPAAEAQETAEEAPDDA